MFDHLGPFMMINDRRSVNVGILGCGYLRIRINATHNISSICLFNCGKNPNEFGLFDQPTLFFL